MRLRLKERVVEVESAVPRRCHLMRGQSVLPAYQVSNFVITHNQTNVSNTFKQLMYCSTNIAGTGQ